MGELDAIAANIIGRASRSLELTSQNLANSATLGYKRRVEFSRILAGSDLDRGESIAGGSAVDFSPGRISKTGNPDDLALLGGGFFIVRAPSGQLLYLRGGRFHRDAEGRLATEGGLVLQCDGGDLVLRDGAFKVSPDGSVALAGEPVGRLDIVDFSDRQALVREATGAFSAAGTTPTPVETPRVQQGAVEMSNVTSGAEMVSMMAALRQAESGQRIMTVYDDLMGRVLTAFGQS